MRDAVMRAVVLVEGISDRQALETLARRRGRDLAGEGVSIVPIGGAQAIAAALGRFAVSGARVAGLCDVAEERHYRRGLERVGFGSDLTRAEMEALGFYVCVEDLEDELVRAAGAGAVERVIEEEGDLSAFRTFQKQPAKRGLPYEKQLHAFMWNRKFRYARALVEALDLANVPRPLDAVLAHV